MKVAMLQGHTIREGQTGFSANSDTWEGEARVQFCFGIQSGKESQGELCKWGAGGRRCRRGSQEPQGSSTEYLTIRSKVTQFLSLMDLVNGKIPPAVLDARQELGCFCSVPWSY